MATPSTVTTPMTDDDPPSTTSQEPNLFSEVSTLNKQKLEDRRIELLKGPETTAANPPLISLALPQLQEEISALKQQLEESRLLLLKANQKTTDNNDPPTPPRLKEEISNLKQQLEESRLQNQRNGPKSATPQPPPAAVSQYQCSMLLKLASEGDTFDKPSARKHKHSSMLFLDISGYTKLAESQGREGAKGTELLSNSLSKFFEKAIRIITSHGAAMSSNFVAMR